MNRITLNGDVRDRLDWRWGSGGTIEIFDIVVGSERRNGRGRRLVNKLLNEIAGMPEDSRPTFVWAITRADNRIAQEFYAELKFKVVAPLYDFYHVANAEGRQTIDAVMYGRRLTCEA